MLQKPGIPHVPPPHHISIKVISAGDQATGKSSLIKRFCEGRFNGKYVSTIGVDYGVKQINISSATSKESLDIKVHFWDLAGSPCFLDVRNEFYKLSQGMILVFSVTVRQSYENLNKWIDEAKKYGGNERVLVAVCGNKIDSGKRVVQEDEARAWAESRGFLYFETSANSGEGVPVMFQTLFMQILQNFII